MIDLVFQNSTGDTTFGEVFLKKIITRLHNELKIDKNISLSISLVEESEIQRLNKEHRGKDKVTDVLSFPMFEGSLKKIPDTKYQILNTIDVGDIFICLPFAKKEAKRENISIEKKLTQLTVHGFLHLMGYDHEHTQPDAERMFGLESQILRKLDVD